MGHEEQLLAEQIRRHFRDVWRPLVIVAETEGEGGLQAIEEAADTYDEAKHLLEYYIDSLLRDISALGERLQLPLFCKDLASARASLGASIRSVSRDLDGNPRNPGLDMARRYYGTLAAMVETTSVSGLSVFRTILENTAAIVANEKISPKKEKDVENAIFKVVRYAFHDAVSQPTINKTLKNYRPEFAVESLMAVAEYKFVHDLPGARSALDGFYADMQGYNGDLRWRNFFAVLYTTAPILHAKDLAAEFRLSKAGLEWTPILVHGTGARSRKQTAPRVRPRPSQ